MAIYLGIDGGGTKTSCLLGDETSVLASGIAGGSNILRVGADAARESLKSAIDQACAAAKVNPAQVQRTCLGVAGAARREVAHQIRDLAAQVVGGKIRVVGDMEIALAAAFGDGPGVITIAGTGSIAYGRNSRAETARAGGWGHAISDEGSGFWLGRSALAAAQREFDEGHDVPLLASAVKAWSCNSREELILKVNASPAPDFASLLPVVLASAEKGDPIARDVLREAGAELARLAGIVLNRIFADAMSVPAAMAGGVFRNSSLVREVFYNRLRAEFPRVNANQNVVEPVNGALALARRME